MLLILIDNYTPSFFSAFFFGLDILQVREDPVFRREGANIHVDSVLSVTQVNYYSIFYIIDILCSLFVSRRNRYQSCNELSYACSNCLIVHSFIYLWEINGFLLCRLFWEELFKSQLSLEMLYLRFLETFKHSYIFIYCWSFWWPLLSFNLILGKWNKFVLSLGPPWNATWSESGSEEQRFKDYTIALCSCCICFSQFLLQQVSWFPLKIYLVGIKDLF